MESIIRFMEAHFMPIAGRIGEQPHLKALRDGIVATIPLLMIGSFFLIIAFPPVASLAKMVEPFVGNLLTVVNATFGIMGLIASVSIAYSLAGIYKIDTLAAGIFSAAAFLLSTPLTKDGNIPLGLMGSRGLFVAMLLSIMTVEIQHFMIKRKIVIKMPDGVPPTVSRSFVALVPGLVILLVVFIINTLLAGFGLSIPEVINKTITTPLLNLGGSLPAVMIAMFIAQLLWSVGIHGQALVMGILSPVLLAFTQQNAAAKAAGEVLPNIISQQFIDGFLIMGGSGCTLALTVLLLTKVKSNQLKALGKVSIWPGIFNINEPIIFGMPVVLNPIMMIPWIVVPLVVCVTTYGAMASGLVDKPFALAPWTTPLLANGFLVTGDWKAVVLQLFNFGIATAIYYPFIALWDKAKVKEESELQKIVASRPAASSTTGVAG